MNSAAREKSHSVLKRPAKKKLPVFFAILSSLYIHWDKPDIVIERILELIKD